MLPLAGAGSRKSWLRVHALGSAGFTGSHSRRNFSVGIIPE